MFYSQENQDKYLEQNIFKGYKNGFFVDVGAHDGKTINNSLYFEETNNWKGICIEPIKNVFDTLLKNRPNIINLNCAVDEKDGTTDFIFNSGYTEMLSGIRKHYDDRHIHRLVNEINVMGGATNLITVPTKKLSTIFSDNNVKRVNYLSIDVEGAEGAVINSIDFNNVFIDVIGFENNYPDSSIKIIDYLKSLNYITLDYKGLDIMMIHKDSSFL